MENKAFYSLIEGATLQLYYAEIVDMSCAALVVPSHLPFTPKIDDFYAIDADDDATWLHNAQTVLRNG